MQNKDGFEAKCPTCGKKFLWDSTSLWRPFCSQRCRDIDLGEWLDEGHRIEDNSPEQPFLPPEDESL
jgi:endogenous inhibitor of DNA gyrase (YacG/DUF329 family)